MQYNRLPPSVSPPPPKGLFQASDHLEDGKHHLLLAASGSVATIKIPEILGALSHHPNLVIRLVLTTSAQKFLQGQSDEQPDLNYLSKFPNLEAIYLDKDEWSPAWLRNAPILHIELRKWAHMLLVAPLSANTMAKMVAGICDSLLLSVLRAWDTDGSVDAPFKPKIPKVVLAPAMNTAMWRHPVTKQHMSVLEGEWKNWVTVLRPVGGALACGDVGEGKMMEWRDIVVWTEKELGLVDLQAQKQNQPAGWKETEEEWKLKWSALEKAPQKQGIDSGLDE